MNCLASLDSTLFLGAAGARVALLKGGSIEFSEGFDRLTGRSAWNTPWGGPPDVRSLAGSNAGEIFANIHVGWIAKSSDLGANWIECIDGLEKDVHQVVVHPDRSETVLAATATGFYLSEDSGGLFERKPDPMPYHYQRAVACIPGSDTFLVSTSRGPHGNANARLYRTIDAAES